MLPDLGHALEVEHPLGEGLGGVVKRVRLAREDELERPIVVEQREGALGIVDEQVEPLVGGEAPREADREVAGSNASRAVLHEVDVLAP